jgi:hypothetical protein
VIWTRALNAEADACQFARKRAFEKVISDITQRGGAAGKIPRIIVTTYYDPFPPAGTVCNDIKPVKLGIDFGLSDGEVRWLTRLRLGPSSSVDELMG